MELGGRRVVVGVAGGIAAYKAAELVRAPVKAGAEVRVVMTAAAQQFVTPLTLQALAQHPVATDTFDLTQEATIGHIQLADWAELLVVAPATADVIARLAHGLANDLLTAVALATPPGVERVDGEAARQMQEAVLARVDGQALVVMTAAVADYRPASAAPHKLKKETWGEAPAITLTKNPDILAELKGRAPVVV